jgi:hypothetical protein
MGKLDGRDIGGDRCVRLLGIVALAVVYMPVESRADAMVDLLNGKKISISVQCQGQVDQGGVWVASLNRQGNLIFKEGGLRGKAKPVEIINGRARDGVMEYTATVSGNELTVFRSPGVLSWRISTTDTIRVSGNSCSATHVVDNGGAGEIDMTCKAVSCTVASAPIEASRPASPTTLFREVDCDQRYPGETGLGLYLKGRYQTTCTVERSYHERDDVTKKQIIRVTACARSDSEMEVPSLARMRARDYAFSLALQALPHPEMDSGGDKDIGCGK